VCVCVSVCVCVCVCVCVDGLGHLSSLQTDKETDRQCNLSTVVSPQPHFLPFISSCLPACLPACLCPSTQLGVDLQPTNTATSTTWSDRQSPPIVDRTMFMQPGNQSISMEPLLFCFFPSVPPLFFPSSHAEKETRKGKEKPTQA